MIQIVKSTKELLWLQPLLLYIGIHFDFGTDLHTDNEPARHILWNNPTLKSNKTYGRQNKILRGSVGEKRENISQVFPSKLNVADISN